MHMRKCTRLSLRFSRAGQRSYVEYCARKEGETGNEANEMLYFEREGIVWESVLVAMFMCCVISFSFRCFCRAVSPIVCTKQNVALQRLRWS